MATKKRGPGRANPWKAVPDGPTHAEVGFAWVAASHSPKPAVQGSVNMALFRARVKRLGITYPLICPSCNGGGMIWVGETVGGQGHVAGPESCLTCVGKGLIPRGGYGEAYALDHWIKAGGMPALGETDHT